MKIELRDILLAAVIVMLGWQMFFSDKEDDYKKPDPVTITVPNKEGSTGNKIIERIIQTPVYLPNYKQPVEVDSKYKELYEKSKDSITRLNLYLEAIRINDYEKVLVDNDTIQITGYAKTRGSLLEYKVDYDIKSFEHTYDPEIIVRRPKLSFGIGVEAGVPTFPNTDFLMKGNIYFENRRGEGLSFGYDTDKRVWLGLKKTFTIKK